MSSSAQYEVGEEIEVGYPYWDRDTNTNSVRWHPATVTKVWAHGECSVQLADSNRHNFFIAEHCRKKQSTQSLGESK